jgi:hypothetical protein
VKPTDPPMEPLDGTAKWVESGPDLLSNDPDMAGLMVRIIGKWAIQSLPHSGRSGVFIIAIAVDGRADVNSTEV